MSNTPLSDTQLSGTVFGGQQAIVGAHVYLMAVTGDGVGANSGSGLPSTSLLSAAKTQNVDSVGAYVLTDVNGGFQLGGDYTCPSATAQVYLYVLGGNPGAGVNPASGLLAALGSCGTAATTYPHISVNEVSTVAAAYALAGFAVDATHVSVGASQLAQTGLQNAFLNVPNLTSVPYGLALSTTPNGNGVPDYAKVYTLANILAACVNSDGTGNGCSTLFANALSGGATGSMPTDTATAAIYIAQHPYVNPMVMQNLFGVQSTQPPFVGLQTQPPDFTVGIHYTAAALNAPQAVAMDASGNALVTNGDGSVTVLFSTGVPSAGSGATAATTEALDGAQNHWFAQGTSGVVEQSGSTVVSPAVGFAGGQTATPAAVAVDGSGDVWLANSVVNSVSTVTELLGAATPLATPIPAGSGSSPAPGVDPSPAAVQQPLSAVSVVHQLQLDNNLVGHNMAVADCLVYVSLQSSVAQQNDFDISKLATVNLCATDSNGQPQPVELSETNGDYAVMNGIAVSGSNLYITYGWKTNPFEVWTTGAGGTAPAELFCIPLFTDVQYPNCGATASGFGALYGDNPYVFGNHVYVPENSDDDGQAVQIVDVSSPAAPVKLASSGITGGVSTGGQDLAGLWAVGSGSTLYVGTIDGAPATDQPVTIRAYNLATDPTQPALLGTFNVPVGYAVQQMSVTGTTVVATLYAAATTTWQLMVVDFSSPSSPTYALATPTAGCGFETQNFIAIQGNYAFAGCGLSTGIDVLQFSNLKAPVVLGEIGQSLTGVGFLVPQGRYLYAVDEDGYLDTLDAGTLFQ